jgi:CheY-like chemotaxis protein
MELYKPGTGTETQGQASCAEKILICDDDRAILDALEIYLRHEGYDVIRAKTARRRWNGLRRSRTPSGWPFLM